MYKVSVRGRERGEIFLQLRIYFTRVHLMTLTTSPVKTDSPVVTFKKKMHFIHIFSNSESIMSYSFGKGVIISIVSRSPY